MNKTWRDVSGNGTTQARNAAVSAGKANRWLESNRYFTTNLVVFCVELTVLGLSRHTMSWLWLLVPLKLNDDFYARRFSFAHEPGVWWYVAVVGLGGPFAIFCIVRCGMPGLVCRHPSGHGLCRMSNPEYDFFHMLWHLSSGLGESSESLVYVTMAAS